MLIQRLMNRMSEVENKLATKDIQIDALRRELDSWGDYVRRHEFNKLDDEIPDWRDIVGAVDIKRDRVDMENPFRKWLSTKSDNYRKRIEETSSAELIGEAIRLFQNEQEKGVISH
jgi:hypothetical protein